MKAKLNIVSSQRGAAKGRAGQSSMPSAKKTSKKNGGDVARESHESFRLQPAPYTAAWQRGVQAGRQRASLVRLSRLALMRRAKDRRLFALASLAVLVFTTVFWTFLSARLHENNADQFIDAYMFEDLSTFTSALFPGAHTFLMKWPLFAVMPFFGHGRSVFMVMTILMVLATIASLIYILYRIVRRPLLFGVLCLGLASVLLLVPAQPYPGALLPANLAMTTTRNLEYILFIWCLYRLLRLKKLKSIYFAFTVLLLAILVASDKLFGVLAVGSIIFTLAASFIVRRKKLDFRVFILPGAAAVIGTLAANILLLAISKSGLTGIVNETSASPYNFITSFKQLAEGLIYGGMSLLTNFGANPVHDVIIIRDLPGELIARIGRWTSIAYLVNAALFAFSVFAAYKVARSDSQDMATRLTKLLLGATAVSLVIFVFTDHYYPVDSRYTVISFFALAVAAATYIRKYTIRREAIAAAVVVLLFALPIGMVRSNLEYSDGVTAMAQDTIYYKRTAQILDAKNIKRLVGDYWKIVPIKALMKKDVAVAPVNTCEYTDARGALVSKKWFSMPVATPTSYLAVQDPQKLTYQGCTLARLATLYGAPSERVKLADNPQSPLRPSVLLMLYSQGFNPLSQEKTPVVPEPPKGPRPLPPFSEKTSCSRGTTLNVVAHQDDDLLFLNPDIQTDIQDGRCVRTVYITAGDAGESYGYWSNRQQGAKAAYAQMYDVPNQWQEERRLVGDKLVTTAYLKDVPQVALVFLRLPDGNRYGEGFEANGAESLRKLFAADISAVRTVDDKTAYTQTQLVDVLYTIMAIDLPDVIRTQNQNDAPADDHPDHTAVGAATRQAAARYRQPYTLYAYTGYPISLYNPNLSDGQKAAKEKIFLTYAKYDGAVCQTSEECGLTYTYGNFLGRQYKETESFSGQ